MTRKALAVFKPSSLPAGRAKGFDVVNPGTGYHEHHYFYRAADGELFSVVAKNHNKATELRKEWQRQRQRAQETRE